SSVRLRSVYPIRQPVYRPEHHRWFYEPGSAVDAKRQSARVAKGSQPRVHSAVECDDGIPGFLRADGFGWLRGRGRDAPDALGPLLVSSRPGSRAGAAAASLLQRAPARDRDRDHRSDPQDELPRVADERSQAVREGIGIHRILYAEPCDVEQCRFLWNAGKQFRQSAKLRESAGGVGTGGDGYSPQFYWIDQLRAAVRHEQ